MGHRIQVGPDKKVTVTLSGELTVKEASTLRENMIKQIHQGHRDFLIDMNEVRFIDSTGLGVLVAIYNRVLSNQGTFVITGLKGLVYDLFEMTQLTRIFDIR